MTFPDFCAQHGIACPPDLKPGPRFIRCGTEANPRGKSAAVKIAEDTGTGFCIDFSSMTEHAVWFPNAKPTARNRDAEIAASLAREAAKEKEQREGTARARRIWDSAERVTKASHPYFARKRIGMLGSEGIRALKCSLLIPMWIDERFVSTQAISPEGEKKFAAGAPSKGGVFWMDRPSAVITILTEGYATAATCFEAVKNSRVCVCFSAANLIEVAKRIDWSGFCLIASDNDWKQPCPWCQKQGEHVQNDPAQPRPEQCRCNPGKTAAIEAARIIGCGWATSTGTGTDFNDEFCERLAEIESAPVEKYRPPSESQMRAKALIPIAARLMNAAKVAM